MGSLFFLIGVFFDLIGSSLPGSLAFFAFIISNFKFAGAIILFFSDDQRLKPVFYASLVFLLFRAIQSTMFHDFIFMDRLFLHVLGPYNLNQAGKKIVATLLIVSLVFNHRSKP